MACVGYGTQRGYYVLVDRVDLRLVEGAGVSVPRDYRIPADNAKHASDITAAIQRLPGTGLTLRKLTKTKL